MQKQKKQILSGRIAALILCFAIFAAAAAPVSARAASNEGLTLTYNGKTAVVDIPEKPVTFAQIQEAFGTPANSYRWAPDIPQNTTMCHEYKENGFLFSFREEPGYDWLSDVKIKITSKKAALNGIKVGMSYSSVKRKLEKNYGESLVTVQKNKKKIKLKYGDYLPVEYTFTNGKVSKIYFWHS